MHDRASLARLAGRYDAINVKLDKTGGLTEALAMAAEAERMGFALMVGCMVATSLAMAPAVLLAQQARFVDLDGPLLLAKDRPDGPQLRRQPGLSAARPPFGDSDEDTPQPLHLSHGGEVREAIRVRLRIIENPIPSPRPLPPSGR